MKHFLIKLLFCLSVAFMLSPGETYARGWESSKTEKTGSTRVVAKDAETEIRSGKGMIVVSVSRPAVIKVYSILGHLVSQETLPAGTSYYSMNTHGVYIVKVGNLTCKVSL